MTALPQIEIDWIRRPRSYEPSLFVNRSAELEAVRERVTKAQVKSPVDEPIINFWGVKGIGKTWILRDLRHRYGYHAEAAPEAYTFELPTCALFVEFADAPIMAFREQLVRALATDALGQLALTPFKQECEYLRQARDTGQIEPLVSALLLLSEQLVPLILLDDAERVPVEDWDGIEREFIEPLVSTGRMLMVVAGRRQIPRWRRFEVRRRVMEPQRSQVRPFDKGTVSSQIVQHRYGVPADLLFPYTAGNPHLVDTIARHIVSWTAGDDGGVLNSAWFADHEPNLLQILRASEAHFLEKIPLDLLKVLDAVSPLRFYRLEALRWMLTEPGSASKKWPERYYLQILRQLDQDTEVVWWDRERRAYVTSQMVRQLVGRRRLLEHPRAYADGHRRALAMYWEGVQEYPAGSEDFFIEIWYHLACLDLSARDGVELRTRAIEALHAAHAYLNPDHFLILRNQLEGDRELLDLLPDDLHRELSQELERLLNVKAQQER